MMAEESEKADKLAGDWLMTSKILDDEHTRELDNYVQKRRESVEDVVTLIEFLSGIKDRLDELDILIDETKRQSIDSSFDEFRKSVETELSEYSLVESVDIDWHKQAENIALDWMSSSFELSEQATQGLDDFVQNQSVESEDDFIQFISQVGIMLNDMNESLDVDIRVANVDALNNFRGELNEGFSQVGLPGLPLDDLQVIEVEREQGQQYSEVEIMTPEPEQPELAIDPTPIPNTAKYVEIDIVDWQKAVQDLEVEWVTDSFKIDGQYAGELDELIMSAHVETEDEYIDFLVEVGQKFDKMANELNSKTRVQTEGELKHFRQKLNEQFERVELPAIEIVDLTEIEAHKEALPDGERNVVEMKDKQPEQPEIAHTATDKIPDKAGTVHLTWIRDADDPKVDNQQTEKPDSPTFSKKF